MGHPIDDHFDTQTPAQLFEKHDREVDAAVLRAELRNQTALTEKLQTLLDSKTHQVEALHKEIDTTRRANELITEAAKRWQARAEKAEAELADCAPDMDTVPLDALLEGVRTFVPAHAIVSISGSDQRIGVKSCAFSFDGEVEPAEVEAVLGHIDALTRHAAFPF